MMSEISKVINDFKSNFKKVPEYRMDVSNLNPKYSVSNHCLNESDYQKFDAVLQIVSEESLKVKNFSKNLPYHTMIANVSKKHGFNNDVLYVTLESGVIIVRFVMKKGLSVFEYMEELREYLINIENSKDIAIDFRCDKSKDEEFEFLSDIVARSVFIGQTRLPGDNHKHCKIHFAGMTKKIIEQSYCFSDANSLTRYLCRIPPNQLTTSSFEEFSKNIVNKYSSLSFKVVSEADLKSMGAGLILAVGAASFNKPRIVYVRYNGLKNKKVNPIALVGKGICYDTGGINVKSYEVMYGMKRDMAGAAIVLSAMIAASRMKLPINIDGYLVLAENSINSNCYKPDDVIRSLNGTNVEVVHSDCEGRMVLADGLSLATSINPKPSAVISLATLTGAMVSALGCRIGGYFSNDDNLSKLAEYSSRFSGDRMEYFALRKDYKKSLDSDIADIKQASNDEDDPDHIMAALFLNEFIKNNIPWVHVDLSASFCKDGLAAANSDETGFGAQWLVEFLRNYPSIMSKK